MKLIQLGGHRFRNKPQKGFAMVDDEDFDMVNSLEWHLSDTGYAVRREENPKRTLRMHRIILDAEDGMLVDHINGDKLDNQKGNLRLCTNTQNIMNSSKLRRNNTTGYKGVGRSKDNKFFAKIVVDKKQIHLGFFSSPTEASEAYKRASINYHKEFSPYKL